MSHISNLLHKSELLDKSKSYVLTTVLQMDETSFFKVGTRIIISNDGLWVGQKLNGKHWGLLTDIVNQTLATNQSQYVVLNSEDLQKETTGVLLSQLGEIHFIVSPLNLNEQDNILRSLESHFSLRESNIIITFISGNIKGWETGKTFDIDFYNKEKKQNIPLVIKAHLEEAILECIFNEKSSLKTIKSKDQKYIFFIEYIKPVPKLIIASKFFEIHPIMQLLNYLSWEITIISNLNIFFEKRDFPNITYLDFEQLNNLVIESDERTAIISLNKDLEDDIVVAKKFLNSKNAFFGVYGTLKKGLKMKEILLKSYPCHSKNINQIKIPIGLNLDVSNIEENIFSVIAQLIELFSKESCVIPEEYEKLKLMELKLKIKN